MGDSKASIEQLWIDVGRCKDAATCPQLTVRARWFEPNPGTIDMWAAERRFTPAVDRRVFFVCESPTAKVLGRPFAVPGVTTQGARCWGGDNATVTDDFWRIREQYGLEHTWITNVVKCGCSPTRKPSDVEVRSCSTFLKRELELVQPSVVAIVGKTKTADIYYSSVRANPPQWSARPSVHVITHYSYARRPGGRGRMMEVWKPEFDRIMDDLRGRGLGHPQWLGG